MIVITGTVMTNATNRDEIERLCVEHSQRSRAEPGCIAHNVHADCENPDRLVFLEVWSDGNAVRAHFGVPASGGFVKSIGMLSTESPTIQIYRADEISTSALAS
jgi:quinol monooxygenase YgiN